mgnify:CR=1 FL=1
MPANHTFIRHTFGGGWAPDFGPNAQVRPTGDGQVEIPWLVDADNLVYELDGGLRKVPGTSAFNSSALESGASIMGITDYWRHGTAGAPAHRIVVQVATKLYSSTGDGTFTEIASGLTDGAIPNFGFFDDFMIYSNDSGVDVPRSWDQTTFQNLAGSPPTFSFSLKHKNWYWAAGVNANPSLLYYSSTLDPETWSGGTSGSISINPNDGDRITGIASWKNDLFVFKGPYKGSIHRITGSSNTGTDAWARSEFITGVGAVWQNSIFTFGDDVGFLWSDGTIRSLKATAAYGDYVTTSLSFPINRKLKDILNFAQLRRAWAVTDDTLSSVLITVPANGSSTPNVILMMDFRFNPVRWSYINAFTPISLARVIDTADNNRPIILLGSNNGVVYKMGRTTRSAAGSGISMRATTPYLDYNKPLVMKTLGGGAIGMQPWNSGNITFGWARDNNTQQTQTVQQGGAAVLDTFLLGTDTLGGGRYLDRFFRGAETGGEFRAIQYQVSNNAAGEDVEIHSISAQLAMGAESFEN